MKHIVFVLLGALLSLAGCDKGFGVTLDVTATCLPDDAEIIITVTHNPNDVAEAPQMSQLGAFLAAPRIVVVPPDGVTDITVVIQVLSKEGGELIKPVTVNVTVDGSELVSMPVALAGPCSDGGVPDAMPRDLSAAVDQARADDLAIDDLEVHEMSTPDLFYIEMSSPDLGPHDLGPIDSAVKDLVMLDLTIIPDLFVACTANSCHGATPVCDIGNSKRCVGCLADLDCPAGALCEQEKCVPGCSMSHGCGDGGDCVDGGLCRGCTENKECQMPTALCDVPTSHCVACLGDGGCPMGQSCEAINGTNECVPGCVNNNQCAMGVAPACCTSSCVDLDSNVEDCGACGKACGALVGGHGAATCVAKTCVAACNSGWADCNGNFADGCEVNLSTDAANCGQCGKACSAPNTMTVSCVASACTIVACKPGFLDCNGNFADGCEVNSTIDPNHCGGCGPCAPVANGTATCANSQCGMSCNNGFVHCSNNPADGCEVNENTDVKNCGKCVNACMAANATPGCAGGQCEVSACTAPYLDCDRNFANGCEVNSSNDVNNCSACGMKCVIANGAASCTNSKCAVASCALPFADCNMNPADGCETNTSNDPHHCGACGNLCGVANGNPSCVSSVCGVASCTAPFLDCDHSYNDGCEVNTSNDANNCGGCAMKCAAIPKGNPSCVASKCVAVCTPGTADCNGVYADGCEVDLMNDANNCGMCNNMCSKIDSCSAGKCVFL